ncbi:MAG: hypothetical protein MJ225_03845 [Bacilli bacterium]|nr:hypothetical protein [Bacilli bacterium]
MKTKKRTLALRISIFILVFAGATFGSYILTPNKTRRVIQNTNNNDDNDNTTPLSRFISKLNGILEYDENENSKLSVHADIKDLTFSWPSEELVNNSILLNGGVDLVSNGLSELKFSAESNIKYNNQLVDLGVGYINNKLYVALDSFRFKTTIEDTTQLFDKIEYYLFDKNNENGLGLTFNLFDKLDSFLEEFNSDDLLSKFDINCLKINETEEEKFNKVTISTDDSSDDFCINAELLLDKETDDLKTLNVKEFEIDGFTAFGKVICTYDNNLQIRALDDEHYPVKRGEFPELVNYSLWTDRMFELLNSRKVGLKFNANIKKNNEGDYTPIADIDLDSNVDFSQVIDLKNISLLTSIPAEDLFSKLYFDVNMNLSNSQSKNLISAEAALLNNEAYLSINDDGESSDLRAKISVSQISNLIEKISSLIETQTSSDDINFDEVFEEIINSDLVTSIKEGRYEKIIQFIDKIENTNDLTKINLNLSLLGFGDDSKLQLVLVTNANAEHSNQIVEISAKSLKISDFCIDFDLIIQEFANSVREKIEKNNLQNKYINFDFAPDIFDQAKELLDTPKSGFALNGFVYDKTEDQFGFSFNGDGQFDYTAKKGFGSIVFNSKTEKRSSQHFVDINVDNSNPDKNQDNMLFAYNTKLKGRINVRTLSDMIELVQEIISSDDPRFTKFIDPIKASLSASLIGSVIESHDYFLLLNNHIFKEIVMNEITQELKIVLSKELLGLNSDLSVCIGFSKQNNKFQIKDISIAFDTAKKQIYVKLVINPYDESKKAKLEFTNVNDFMDFTDIKVLIEFGIMTTKLGVYHLTADVTATILGLFTTTIPLDFYVEVNGETTKVYGQAKISPLLMQIGRTSHTVYSEFVFEPGYVEGDKIGGLIHMVRTDVRNSTGNISNKYYWVSDTNNFMDNIIPYLCKDYFTLQSIAYSQIESAANKTQATKDPAYENMFVQPLVYSKVDLEHIWKTTLSLEAMTGNSNLGNLTIDLRGSSLTKGKGYFTNATVNVTFVSIVSLDATINLVDINASLTHWDAFDIFVPGIGNTKVKDRYNFIKGIFSGMSETDINTYFNQPLNSYTSF